MIGITAIGKAAGSRCIDNVLRAAHFNRNTAFITGKIGFTTLRRLGADEGTASLCLAAYQDLQQQCPIQINDIQVIVVVTQNPEGHGLPHTAALIHGALGCASTVAAFDLSLGCSGYVYALSIVSSFMEANGLETGLLFTADPYSRILDTQDINTELLFGDAATCTLLTCSPKYRVGKSLFSTEGAKHDALYVTDAQKLVMNGRGVYSFTMKAVPQQIEQCLERNQLTLDDMDMVLLHQASRFIVTGIAERLGLPESKVPFLLADIGNCVSSTLPYALARIWNEAPKTLLLSGFGVGLSWASTILFRTEA